MGLALMGHALGVRVDPYLGVILALNSSMRSLKEKLMPRPPILGLGTTHIATTAPRDAAFLLVIEMG